VAWLSNLNTRITSVTSVLDGDILGDKKKVFGMVPKLLTDARETSYVI